MVSPLVAKTPEGPKYMWTIDANVGLASRNKPDDVQLVQFAYVMALGNAQRPKSLAEKETYAKVVPGAPCTGRADDPLVRAIVAHQQARGGTQDGHVSPFSASTVMYVGASGKHSHMLWSLNLNIMGMMPYDFPRLDKHPLCPPGLKSVVIDCCEIH